MMMAMEKKKKLAFWFGLVYPRQVEWLWNWLIKIIIFSFRFIIKIIVIIDLAKYIYRIL